MSQTQKALVVTEVGKPIVAAHDVQIPQPALHQIQMKVKVAGLNPHDQKARDGGLFIADSLPAILSNDVVGEVTQVGFFVRGVNVGDRVVSQPSFSHRYDQTGLQQYVIADTGAFAKIPDSITDDEAATLPTNLIASMVALHISLGVPAPWTAEARDFDSANTTLLVVGGGSSCGKFAVQLAKLAGIGRIVVVGGPEAELKSFGATHVLDRHGGDDVVQKRIRDVVGDDLVYALDTISPVTEQYRAINALSNHKRGRLARLLPMGPVDLTHVNKKPSDYEVADVAGSSQAFPEIAAGFWNRLTKFLELGQIKPLQYVTAQGLEPDVVNAVLDKYRDGKPVTKTHIHL